MVFYDLDDPVKFAKDYARRGFNSSTDLLAFRDLPQFLAKYVKGKRALDYGCGPSRSSKFLKDQGFEVVGVDVNQCMVDEAKRQDPTGTYQLIQSGNLLYSNKSFDLALIAMVFFEVSTKNEIINIITDIKRVLHPGGILIASAGTEEFYRGTRISNRFDFPKNKTQLRSGRRVKNLLLPQNIILEDYSWSDRDYKDAFASAGLTLLEEHRTHETDQDGPNWLDEKMVAPHVNYILRA